MICDNSSNRESRFVIVTINFVKIKTSIVNNLKFLSNFSKLHGTLIYKYKA